jgi:hypothetical protein
LLLAGLATEHQPIVDPLEVVYRIDTHRAISPVTAFLFFGMVCHASANRKRASGAGN